jgi:hypothetical protein
MKKRVTKAEMSAVMAELTRRRNKIMTPEQRRASALKAINTRWARVRAARAAAASDVTAEPAKETA